MNDNPRERTLLFSAVVAAFIAAKFNDEATASYSKQITTDQLEASLSQPNKLLIFK